MTDVSAADLCQLPSCVKNAMECGDEFLPEEVTWTRGICFLAQLILLLYYHNRHMEWFSWNIFREYLSIKYYKFHIYKFSLDQILTNEMSWRPNGKFFLYRRKFQPSIQISWHYSESNEIKTPSSNEMIYLEIQRRGLLPIIYSFLDNWSTKNTILDLSC